MPDQKQQDETFRVIDRRLFNPDGEIRDEAARDERQKRESDAAATASAGPAAPSGKSDIVQPAQGSPAKTPDAKLNAPQAPPAPAPDANAPKPSRGLEMLINFVAQNAAMLLGAYPDPRTGEAMLDLEGARELVDMLDALRETTRGNLASEDEKLLVDVISSLKLSFMEMTKAAAKAMQDKTKASR